MEAGRYPVALLLRGQAVLVVGGGAVAARKIAGLLEAGARVRVVARRVGAAVRSQAAAAHGECLIAERDFAENDLEGAALAFAATDDLAVNANVVAAARARRVLVCDAADWSRGDFTTPAVHRAGPLTFAVDTNGLAPAFAVRLRDELRERYDARYGRATETLGTIREYVNIVAAGEPATHVLREMAAAPVEQLANMNRSDAENAVDERLAALTGTTPIEAAVRRPLVVATRASALALRQTRTVMARLAARGIASEIVEIASAGDVAADRPLQDIGTDGIFVKRLEHALREHRADYAVHSCKDLPSVQPGDMQIAAITARADSRDAFCSERYATFDDLPPGAVVGTSSPRRSAHLRALRADVRYEPIRGNVDTRLRKLREGHYDAIILALAGLERLGIRATHTVPFGRDQLVAAPGQGALAIECRADDEVLAQLLHDVLADPRSEREVAAERAVLRELNAGCDAPVGAAARYSGDELTLTGSVAAVDGSRVLRAERTALIETVGGTIADADALGVAIAADLRAEGADALLGREAPLAGRLFLLPRTRERASRIAPALRSAGAEVVEARNDGEASRGLGARIPDVVLFPSSGAAGAIAGYLRGLRTDGPRPLVAAMGAASAAAARELGFPPDLVPNEAAVGPFVQGITHLVLERSPRL